MSSAVLRLSDLPAPVQDELNARGEVHLRLVVDHEVRIAPSPQHSSIADLFGVVRVARPLSDAEIEEAIEAGATEDLSR